jgi:CRP/FNR family transcriptional regulator
MKRKASSPPPTANLHLPATMMAGALASLAEDAKSLIARQMRPVHFRAGEAAFHAGDKCSNYLVVREGAIRVSVMTEGGREIVLYRVMPGETCVLTAACLLSSNPYEAQGVAEADTDAIIIPKRAFEELLAISPEFRRFVFSSYGERLHLLIGLVQEIAVRHVDKRLARLLLTRAENGAVAMTHQAIAGDLNTAREVVTRLLQDFVRKGFVALERGRILIRDEDALAAFAAAP